MAIENFFVSAGRLDFAESVFDVETGVFQGHRTRHCHGVEVRTRWGHSFVHHFRFPDTDAGLVRANRFAARVEDFIRANGVDKLDLNHWEKRTIYGSDAYLDEEPDLVESERHEDFRNDRVWG